MDYANLEFQTLDLQHQHHKCKSHKRTLFSHKEILLVFALIGLFNIPRTGCDDTENFQKNSKYKYNQSDHHFATVYLISFLFGWGAAAICLPHDEVEKSFSCFSLLWEEASERRLYII
jgi:hypothetical protein